MRLALMTEPQQGLTYDEIVAAARTAEEAGLEAFFRSDHYASFPGPDDEPTTDAWATLAGLARDTSRISIGSLVSPMTFRLPGAFAKLVATVDEMSGGRVEVGMGAGWNDLEHAQLGIPFPDLDERYTMLEESVAIVHGLWTEPDGWRLDGPHWQVRDALFRTRPERNGRRHPPIILGGRGGPRLARLAAQYADEFNLNSASPVNAPEAYARIDAACQAIGRDPGEIARSAMTGVLIAETRDELTDRLRAQLELTGGAAADAEAWLAQRQERWIMGTLDEAGERLRAFERAGVQRVMLQDFIPRDLAMIRLMGRLGA
jgi:F420-dependent oxidoreductase-like protein